VIPGVGDGDVVSVPGHGHAPWIEEFSISVPTMSKGGEEESLGSEDLNSVVVLVRDEDPVSGDVVGDSSGAMKLSRSNSRSTEDLDKVSFRGVNENLVVKTVRDQNLKIRIRKETGH
jgi:hypothetical protein